MTVTTHQTNHRTHLVPPTHYPQAHKTPQPQQTQHHASLMVWSSLKASIMGGVGLWILMVLSLIPVNENVPVLTMYLLVVPGFIVVCFATGLLASIMANDSIQSSSQGGKVGWMAGFWAGIIAGVGAMALAAGGFFWVEYGEHVASEMAWLTSYGLTAETVSLAARVFMSLIGIGIIGSLICAIISSVGGMVYPKLGLAE